MMEATGPQLLTELIKTTLEQLRVTLGAARLKAEDDCETFLQKGYGVLHTAIGAYANLLKRCGADSRKELERRWSAHYLHEDVRETLEALLDMEEAWDRFLYEVDEHQTSSQGYLGVTASDGTNLLEIGEQVLLRDVHSEEDKLSALNCDVHIISFGELEGAKQWHRETESTFPMWIDRERQLYRLCGFPRSLHKVWNIETMIYYGECVARDVLLPKSLPHIEDDPLQMGGNLIVDRHGKIVQLYSSQTPADRPSVEEIIRILQGVQSS